MSDAVFKYSSIKGKVTVPGSKSYTQRYILLSAFSNLPVIINNPSFSEDEDVAVEIARSSGSTVEVREDTIEVSPHFSCPGRINVGESATSFRLSLGLLSVKKCVTEIDMSESLIRRESTPIIRALEDKGAVVRRTETGFKIDATSFSEGDITISGTGSSQYTSAALFTQALSHKNERKVIVTGKPVSSGYIDITLECLKSMGITVLKENGSYSLGGSLDSSSLEVNAETDMSSLSAVIVLGLLCSESGITIEKVSTDSKQPDYNFINLLKEAGFRVHEDLERNTINVRKSSGSHITVDADATPDLAVIASVIGIFSKAGVTILNTGRLTGKESDRKSSIIELARSFSAKVEADEDRIVIHEGEKGEFPDQLHFKDHRIVMASVIASLASGSETVIGDLKSIGKSYSGFIHTLENLGVEVRLI